MSAGRQAAESARRYGQLSVEATSPVLNLRGCRSIGTPLASTSRTRSPLKRKHDAAVGLVRDRRKTRQMLPQAGDKIRCGRTLGGGKPLPTPIPANDTPSFTATRGPSGKSRPISCVDRAFELCSSFRAARSRSRAPSRSAPRSRALALAWPRRTGRAEPGRRAVRGLAD